MWPFDQPLYIVVTGIVLGVIVGGLWMASGRKEMLFALGGVVALTVVWLIVERVVVTDREEIRATLVEIARDVQNNDLNRLLGHLSQSNPSLAQRAKAEMPNYKFTECRITQIHGTDVDSDSEPRSAIIEFNVQATGTFNEGSFGYTGTVPRWVQLQMVREKDGRWRVQDYKHAAPDAFMYGQPSDDLAR